MIEGRPAPTRSADAFITWYRVVSANYFATMEIPLKRGRLFADREAEPTVVVNESMAKRFWPGEDAIGRRVRFGGQAPWMTIVGIVADVQVRGARDAERRRDLHSLLAQPGSGHQRRAEDRWRSGGARRAAAARRQGRRSRTVAVAASRRMDADRRGVDRQLALLRHAGGDLRGAGARPGGGRASTA